MLSHVCLAWGAEKINDDAIWTRLLSFRDCKCSYRLELINAVFKHSHFMYACVYWLDWESTDKQVANKQLSIQLQRPILANHVEGLHN